MGAAYKATYTLRVPQVPSDRDSAPEAPLAGPEAQVTSLGLR